MSVNQAILDAGATCNFILSGAPPKNIQLATNPPVIHLPDGETLDSTHTSNLYLPWLHK